MGHMKTALFFICCFLLIAANANFQGRNNRLRRLTFASQVDFSVPDDVKRAGAKIELVLPLSCYYNEHNTLPALPISLKTFQNQATTYSTEKLVISTNDGILSPKLSDSTMKTFSVDFPTPHSKYDPSAATITFGYVFDMNLNTNEYNLKCSEDYPVFTVNVISYDLTTADIISEYHISINTAESMIEPYSTQFLQTNNDNPMAHIYINQSLTNSAATTSFRLPSMNRAMIDQLTNQSELYLMLSGGIFAGPKTSKFWTDVITPFFSQVSCSLMYNGQYQYTNPTSLKQFDLTNSLNGIPYLKLSFGELTNNTINQIINDNLVSFQDGAVINCRYIINDIDVLGLDYLTTALNTETRYGGIQMMIVPQITGCEVDQINLLDLQISQCTYHSEMISFETSTYNKNLPITSNNQVILAPQQPIVYAERFKTMPNQSLVDSTNDDNDNDDLYQYSTYTINIPYTGQFTNFYSILKSFTTFEFIAVDASILVDCSYKIQCTPSTHLTPNSQLYPVLIGSLTKTVHQGSFQHAFDHITDPKTNLTTTTQVFMPNDQNIVVKPFNGTDITPTDPKYSQYCSKHVITLDLTTKTSQTLTDEQIKQLSPPVLTVLLGNSFNLTHISQNYKDGIFFQYFQYYLTFSTRPPTPPTPKPDPKDPNGGHKLLIFLIIIIILAAVGTVVYCYLKKKRIAKQTTTGQIQDPLIDNTQEYDELNAL